MIEKKDGVSIQDNYLPKEEFEALRGMIMDGEGCPWYFRSRMTTHDPESTPGFFAHLVYPDCQHAPTYDSFLPILSQLDCDVLTRIRINLNHRLPEPYFGSFHSDTEMDKDIDPTQWTVSILYINTNNGYTELESGQRIESVANRLVSFPSNIKHRGVTQTDEQTRIVVNFNYLK